MNPNQKTFADEILKGSVPIEAALIAWPGIVRKTARNKACTMGKNEEVQKYIKDNKAVIDKTIQEEITKSVIEEVAKDKTFTILTALRKRAILAQIAEGKKTYEKVVIIDGKVKRIKCKPDAGEIMKAIDLDNKMSGDHVQAKPNIVAKAQEVEKVIMIQDETQPPDGSNDLY